jgi:undecaprenyl-diphosphatase
MDVAVHMGTLVAVVMYNWRDINRMFLSFITMGRHYREYYGVAVSAFIATIPVLIAGFLLNQHPALLELLRSVEVIAWATLVFGILLGFADRSKGHRRFTTTSMIDAICIGLAQVLALIPGTSRSGITMTAARGLGLSRRAAARFSMILSIPVILGSGVLTSWLWAVARNGWRSPSPH